MWKTIYQTFNTARQAHFIIRWLQGIFSIGCTIDIHNRTRSRTYHESVPPRLGLINITWWLFHDSFLRRVRSPHSLTKRTIHVAAIESTTWCRFGWLIVWRVFEPGWDLWSNAYVSFRTRQRRSITSWFFTHLDSWDSWTDSVTSGEKPALAGGPDDLGVI